MALTGRSYKGKVHALTLARIAAPINSSFKGSNANAAQPVAVPDKGISSFHGGYIPFF